MWLLAAHRLHSPSAVTRLVPHPDPDVLWALKAPITSTSHLNIPTWVPRWLPTPRLFIFVPLFASQLFICHSPFCPSARLDRNQSIDPKVCQVRMGAKAANSQCYQQPHRLKQKKKHKSVIALAFSYKLVLAHSSSWVSDFVHHSLLCTRQNNSAN